MHEYTLTDGLIRSFNANLQGKHMWNNRVSCIYKIVLKCRESADKKRLNQITKSINALRRTIG